jgi:hypothetical protein
MFQRGRLITAIIVAGGIGLAFPVAADATVGQGASPSAPLPFITCGAGEYQNSDGTCVPDPTQAPTAPPGATALCNDGSWSFSKHRSGTCSGHGGVAYFL